MTKLSVIKRDGRVEELTPEKYTQVCEWACHDIKGVSASDLAMKSYNSIYDGITTTALHEIVIKTAVGMIDDSTPNYDKVAARLVIYQIRKEVYGGYKPPHIYEIVKKNVELGVYTSELLEMYTEEDYDTLETIIKHERDSDFTYAATEQLRSKYLVQDRSKGTLYESPQVTYLLVAAVLFHNEPVDKRMGMIKEYYNAQSKHLFSIPSPIAAGVRTPVKQFSSCVLIPVGDSLNSICTAGEAIVKYVSQKAGIGLDIGEIRAVGSKVKDGSVKHTGLLPFIKKFKGDLKSCSQGGLRSGAATVYYPWWHYEFPELIVLKNNSGTEESRERHLDYGVQFNGLIFERFLSDSDVTLFSPHDVPVIKDTFYRGGDFKKAYELAENDPLIRKRTISAKELITNFCLERAKTGRIYPMFMDNMLNQGSFVDLAEGEHLSSNLCVAPETLVTTREGHLPIKDLVGCNVDVWNGEEWSNVEVVKTGENQKLFKVTTDNGNTLDCTAYHKWYVYGKNDPETLIEKRTFELEQGDQLELLITEDDSWVAHEIKSIVDNGRVDDTYCFNEPKRHRGVFNGILTGQCLEIGLPIKPSSYINDPEGLVALCTLSSINWGKLKHKEDLEKPCRAVVRALDNLLSYQEYPVLAAKTFTDKYRALGVGIVGMAHFLAKRDLGYNINSAEVVDEYMEAMTYYLTDESVRIAQEKGACDSVDKTCYGKGIFPWERRNINIDSVVPLKLHYDWEELRERMLKYGIRNATLQAVAPTESSSTLLGETNGIEPPLMGIVEKVSKDGKLKQLVPEYHHLKNKYDYKWGQKGNKGYLVIMAVIQKWVDQAISSNTNYDPSTMKDNKVPLSLLIQDLFFAYNLGLKTLYYHNTNDMSGIEEEEGCESGACKI